MKLDRYELKAGKSLSTFEFLSEGKKGKIIKVIQFQRMNHPNLFNLAFGDKSLESGEINDLSITDNGDPQSPIVLVCNEYEREQRLCRTVKPKLSILKNPQSHFLAVKTHYIYSS